ncbi:GNAT family N-acetyltransferase [Devosia submarina]|uniref:GNAT family N-acetyltransferase n=1 Tax=Devosia submarina TaxID=1173082 RepID=UPI000D352D4A|nr:GNAT family N-acetyltransferase [Devosia submarina]
MEDAEQWSRQRTTHSGFSFYVRPARPEDESELATFFEHVTPEDRRFRFLSSVKLGHDQLAAMTNVDHHQTESFVALGEGGKIVATGMLACDADLAVGEVAISVSGEFKNRGIGWEMLRHLTQYAEARGIQRLQSLENRANKSAIQIEEEFGFKSETYPGDSTLVLLQQTLAA